MVEAAQQFLEANPEAYRDAAKTAH
jgi:hypothetical protein